MLLAMDVGGSTTKVVGCTPQGKIIDTLQMETAAPVETMRAALAAFLRRTGKRREEIEEVVLTGVGASFLDGALEGLPTSRVEELTAIGRGGLVVSGLREALVVSMGTGTAFVHASPGKAVHLGGSGLGGGTLRGLASRLLGEDDARQVLALAQAGDLRRVDLQMRDICREAAPTLPPDLTASNFGKLAAGATDADVALGLVHMLLENIGVFAVLACRGAGLTDAVCTGSFAGAPQAQTVFSQMQALFGVRFHLPADAAFATALGAVALRREAPDGARLWL